MNPTPRPYPVGREYDERFERLAAAGHDVHGEASFVMGYGPRTVLDAGCGTGRVAIELAARGCRVVGLDNDPQMLAAARAKARDLPWIEGDLAKMSLKRKDGERIRFDVVVAAGNVMIFVDRAAIGTVVRRCAAHLNPGGLLIAGFQLNPGGLAVADYDAACDAAGLGRYERWSSWTRDRWSGGEGYLVAVHRRAPSTARAAPADAADANRATDQDGQAGEERERRDASSRPT